MKPYSELLDHANRVAAGLTNAGDPTICPQCFQDFSSALVADPARLPRLRADCHAVFDACLTLLCTWFRVRDDFALLLLLASNTARCPIHGRRITRLEAASSTLPLEFYNTTWIILTTALDAGSKAPAMRVLSNKSFSDRAGRWPSKIDMLFPLGVEDTVSALLEFGERFSSPAPMSVFKDILWIARSIVWPVIISEPYRRRFLTIIITLIDPANGAKTYPDTHWLHVLPVIELAAGLLRTIRDGPDSLLGEHKQFVRGDAELLFNAIVPTFDKLPDSSPLFGELASWYRLLHDDLPAGKKPLPKRVVQFLYEHQGVGKPEFEISVLAMVVHLVRTRICSFCGLLALHNDGGKALSLCAGCKVVLYCSKPCQKQHWQGKGDRVPHKAVCAILPRLNAHKYAESEDLVFIRAFRKLNFTAEEMAALAAFVLDMRRLVVVEGTGTKELVKLE
ncbi:hypothetical protein AURDEDRAFT_116573 [Auricularia subglabra TFB-10046 SS5]|nr:hypothetical protein AURDEDRAFT_116573 [Auricularia subglabra TFB-10046 SS5]